MSIGEACPPVARESGSSASHPQLGLVSQWPLCINEPGHLIIPHIITVHQNWGLLAGVQKLGSLASRQFDFCTQPEENNVYTEREKYSEEKKTNIQRNIQINI